MTTRDAFLARIRAAQPMSRPRPDMPFFPSPTGERRVRFRLALEAMGGTCVEVEGTEAMRAMLAERFGADAVICSAVPSFEGNRLLALDTPPASLQDIDVGVVRARFGVAETGSVWFSETEYVVNSIGYLAQHLVVLLDPEQIVDSLQEVYRRQEFKAARYAVLVTGPSATADIEGMLIHGAQGVRSLTLVWAAPDQDA